MRKLNVIALLLYFGGICGTFSEAADFGVANWGMTVADVKSIENRPNLTPFGEHNYLIYAITLDAIENTRLVYQFKNGYLTEGRFIFRPNNPLDAQTAITQYNQVKAMLTNQYGPPDDDLIVRKRSDTPISPVEYANELASDRLILKTQWHSPTAILKHQLAWHNGKPHHQIHYIPTSEKQ